MSEKKLEHYDDMEIPDTIEDIRKEPIIKPLLDYQKALEIIKKEDASESHYLNEKMEALNKLLETGIYTNSLIALRYKDVLEVYKRLLFIYQKYSEMVEKRIIDIRGIVKKYYIPLEEHKRLMELNQKKEVHKEAVSTFYEPIIPEPPQKKTEKKIKKEVKDIDD